MRSINKIVIHCSATMEGKPFNAESIRQMHLQRGFNDIGYHFVVLLDGTVEEGRSLETVGAHASGHNRFSIGICYIGGIGKTTVQGRPNVLGPKDTRTAAQKASMQNLVRQLRMKFPKAVVVGHRDLSPDLNKDGKITSEEFIKACPCFNAMTEYNGVGSATAKGGALAKVSTPVVTKPKVLVDPDDKDPALLSEAGGEKLNETTSE